MPEVTVGSYTAVIRQDGEWWIGWVIEIPGVNAQERTRPELIDSLREALGDVLQMNREAALNEAGPEFEHVAIAP